MRGALAIGLLVGLVAVAPAQGATVRIEPVYSPFDCFDRVVYEGAQGEFNEVHVQGTTAVVHNPVPGPGCGLVQQTVEISEVYHPLFAGEGCRQLTTRSVACTILARSGDRMEYLFRLGDRDDLLSFGVAHASAQASCGTGVDWVIGAVKGDADCEVVRP